MKCRSYSTRDAAKAAGKSRRKVSGVFQVRDMSRQQRNREAARKSYWKKTKERAILWKKCELGEQNQISLHRQLKQLRSLKAYQEYVLAHTICKSHNQPESFGGGPGPPSPRGTGTGIPFPLGVPTPVVTPAVTPGVTPVVIPGVPPKVTPAVTTGVPPKVTPAVTPARNWPENRQMLSSSRSTLATNRAELSSSSASQQPAAPWNPGHVPGHVPAHLSPSGSVYTDTARASVSSLPADSPDFDWFDLLEDFNVPDPVPLLSFTAGVSALPFQNQPDEYFKASDGPKTASTTATAAEAVFVTSAAPQPVPEASSITVTALQPIQESSYPGMGVLQPTPGSSYLTMTGPQPVSEFSYPGMGAPQPIPGFSYPTMTDSQPVPESFYPTMTAPQPIPQSSYPGIGIPLPIPGSSYQKTSAPQLIPASSYSTTAPQPTPEASTTTPTTAATGQERTPSAAVSERVMSEGTATAAVAGSSRVVPSARTSSSVAPVLSDSEGTSLSSSNTLELLQFLRDIVCGGQDKEEKPRGEEKQQAPNTEPPAERKISERGHHAYDGTQRGPDGAGVVAESVDKMAESVDEMAESVDESGGVVNGPDAQQGLSASQSCSWTGGGHGDAGGDDEKRRQLARKMADSVDDDDWWLMPVKNTALTIDDVNVKLKKKYL